MQNTNNLLHLRMSREMEMDTSILRNKRRLKDIKLKDIRVLFKL